MKDTHKLNPDEDHVKRIREGINKLGGHCPCIPKFLHNEHTLCPCFDFRVNDICHCNLYVSK